MSPISYRCSFLVILILDTCCVAGEPEDTLLQIAAANEANYQSIENWEAEYKCEDESFRSLDLAPTPDFAHWDSRKLEKVRTIRGGDMQFTFDRVTDRVLWEYAEDYADREVFDLDGMRIDLPERYKNWPLGASYRVLYDNGNLYRLFPEVKAGPLPDFPDDPYHDTHDGSSFLVTQTRLPASQRGRSPELDWEPRRFFCVSNNCIWDRLRGLAGGLAGAHGEKSASWLRRELSLERSDTQIAVAIKMRSPAGHPEWKPTELIKFDKDHFLPSEAVYTWSEGVISRFQSWKWKRAGETWIPSEVRVAKYSPEGELKFDRTASLKSSKLNRRLADDAFDVDQLGISDGDRIVDKTANELFVLSNGLPVMASSTSTSEVIVSQEKPTTSYVKPILVSVTIFLVLGLLWKWRTRR